jgi:SulP family sulfate permease
VSNKQHTASTSPAHDGPAQTSAGAEFRCASCGHSQSLPVELLGRQAKCPKCGALGKIISSRPPDESDVRLDDLLESAPPPAGAASARPASPADADSLALDAAPRPVSLGGHLRHFFSGNPFVNLLAGLAGGAHVGLVCLALAMLAFTVDPAAGLAPHALVLLLLPAVFGSVLLALNGRLAVSVGAPEPSAVLCVFLLLAALGADLAGRVPAPELSATLMAALTLAGVLSGLLGIALSKFGLAERVRFLPGEVLGGMLAGFGLLLIKAWGLAMLAGTPSLAALAAQPFSSLGTALLDVWPDWAPAVGFALLYFVVQMSVRGMLWPLLLTAVVVGAWNALTLHLFVLPAPLEGLQAALTGPQAGLPHMLDMGCYLALLEPQTLSNILWPALAARAEFFAAVAAVAILPSIMRTSILESVLCRDANADGQMRLLGAATTLSGAVGGLPSSLSLSSSLGMRELGASGPVAGFTAGLACLGLLLAGGPALAYIPKFVPLGLLLATGLTMPVSWMLRDARNPLSRKDDLRAAWAACLMVAFLGPVLGVFASLGLGVVLSLSRAVAGGGVRFLQTGDVFHSNVERSPSEQRLLREQGGRILVLRLRGYLFLGTLYGLMQTIKERLRGGARLSYVLLDFGAVSGLGAPAAIGFRRLESLAREHGLTLFITSAPLEMEEQLEGLGYRMGDDSGVCRIALNLDYALEWCEDALLAEAGAAETRQESLEELLAATFPEPRLVPALMKCLERVEAPRKARIITQGDPSDAMYFLQSGKVQVELALPGGKVLRLKKMGPGTVFGEMGIYTNAPRSASVIATEKCVVYKLSVERFALVQSKAPLLAAAVNRFVVSLLAERVAEANAQARATQLG